jgi:rod shape-determining protein MreC
LKEFLKTKGIRLGLVLLAVALVVSIAANVLQGKAGIFENIAGAIKAPVQGAAMSLTDWLEGVYGYLYEYDQLQAENEELKKQLAEAQKEARLAADANEENERFRQLLELKEKRSDFVFESAKILSWNPSNWASTFTISKGSDSGIELGDCVVTEYEALVGQIIELGDTWATVRTVIDVDMDVGALVGRDSSAAMIAGDFLLMQEGKSKLTYLSEGLQLIEGDTVLTSGKGGKFPQGLVIGTVSEVLTEAGGQTPYGVVEPACDMDKLSQVFVIKEFEVVE